MRLIVTIRDIILIGIIFVYAFTWNIKMGLSDEPKTDIHKNKQCNECHSLIASIDNTPFSFNHIDAECRSCHSSIMKKNKEIELGFHNDLNRPCRNCHSYHDPGNVLAGDRTFYFNATNANIFYICGSCHNEKNNLSNLSDGHVEAANLFHSDSKYLRYISPSEACLFCHGNTGSYGSTAANIVSEIKPASAPQIHQQASHPYGVQFDTDSPEFQTNFKNQDVEDILNLPNGKIECQTCHNITGYSEKLLAFGENQEMLCQSCHFDK